MYDNFCNDIRFNEGESMHHTTSFQAIKTIAKPNHKI